MYKKLLVLYLVFITLSCSSDKRIDELEKKLATQEAIIKSKNDSLAKVVLETEKKQREVEAKLLLHEKKAQAKLLLEDKTERTEILVSKLNDANNKLAMAKANFNNMSSFKLGRSSSTRNAEIQKAEFHVDNWKKIIADLETELENLNEK